MPHPFDIEKIRSYTIDSGEWRVEFLAAILLMRGPVALHEAIPSGGPYAMNVDTVVELGWSDLGQESRLQNLANESFTCNDDSAFFQFVG
jgi:hypothetical protein